MSGFPTVLSIVPDLKGGRGHMLSYHLALSEAARSIGWRHLVVTAPDPEIVRLPDCWNADLVPPILEIGYHDLLSTRGRLAIASGILALAASLRRAVRSTQAASTGELILFMERFNALQLAALPLALALLPRRHLHLWLMFRHEPGTAANPGGRMLRFSVDLLGLLLGNRFSLVTDTEPLRHALVRYHARPVTVLPIPHTVATPMEPGCRDTPERVLWWPGPPREDKGWGWIRRLAMLEIPSAGQCWSLRLALAVSAGVVAQPRGIPIVALPEVLSADDYDGWMFRAHAVLLPYDPKRYRAASSGIFTEAVVAGAMPLVTAGTWMASELERFGLPELVLDWARPDLLEHIDSLLRAPELGSRLAAFRDHYRTFHCVPSFAVAMQDLHAREGSEISALAEPLS